MNRIDRIRNEIRHQDVQKKLERIGFYRKYYDTDGRKLSSVINGIAMFSEKTNLSGDTLAILITNRKGQKTTIVRVTGYDTEKDDLVKTPHDGLYESVESSEKVAVIAAEAMRVFLKSETIPTLGDSVQVYNHERTAISSVRKTDSTSFS